jgi:hypothetical protein
MRNKTKTAKTNLTPNAYFAHHNRKSALAMLQSDTYL